MKKVFLTAAVILGGLSSYAIQAVSLYQVDEIVMVKEGFRQIKISELPKAVLEALATDFNTATLERAYENANQEYKLHISVQEVTSAVHAEMVYVDKDGNWINKERFFNQRNNAALVSSTTKK